MRPIKLELNNFGSYKNETIDFSQLGEEPVFLITGDTGAGKSMIFDAMVYALFDKTASGRDKKELRSTFASLEDGLTRVRFIFEQSGKLYRITRQPTQYKKSTRNKNGVASQPAEVELAIVDEYDKEIKKLASTQEAVDREVYGILGLGLEQFKQIVLLPQNEFKTFLESNTKDKKKVLKKIFPVAVYEKVQEKLDDRSKKMAKQLEDVEGEIEHIYSDEIWELQDVPEAERLGTIETQLQANKEELEQVSESILAVGKKIEELEEEKSNQEAINAKLEQWEESKQDYQRKIIEQEPVIESYKIRREKLEFAQSLEKTVSEHEREKEQIARITKDLEKSAKKEKELESQKELLQQREENLEKQAKELGAVDKKLEELYRMSDASKVKEEHKQKLNAIQERKKSTSSKKETLENQYNEVQTELASLEETGLTEIDLNKKKGELEKLEIKEKSLFSIDQERRSVTGKIENTKKRKSKIYEELQSSEEKLEELRESLLEKKSSSFNLMVAKLRKDLKPDQECAVCGSKEHPFAQTTIDMDGKNLADYLEEIEQLEDDFSKKNTDLMSQREEYKHLQETLSELEENLSRQQDTLDTEYQEFVNLYKESSFSKLLPPFYDSRSLAELFALLKRQLEENQEKFNEEQQQKRKQEETLDKLKKAIQKTAQDLLGYETEYKTLAAEVEKIDDSYSNLKPSSIYEAEIKDIKTKKERYNQDKKDLDSDLIKYKEDETELITLKSVMEEKLKEAKGAYANYGEMLNTSLRVDTPITNLDNLLDCVNQLKELPEIRDKITTYETTKEALEKSLKEFEEELKGKEAVDLVPMIEELKEQKKYKEELINKKGQEQSMLSSREKSYEKLKKLMSEKHKVGENSQEIKKLANTLIPKEGVRYDLITHVLRKYLSEVIDYANEHYYKKLTNNAYQLQLSENIRKQRNSEVGLELYVQGQFEEDNRPVNTLSGGETFQTALAIALSLSDIVQDKFAATTIETLFIDEGFGSLDEEALDRAMLALEQVGEDRLVGIISHVSELKKRLNQQLQVKKDRDGVTKIKQSY